jgi:hypothetical protein
MKAQHFRAVVERATAGATGLRISETWRPRPERAAMLTNALHSSF